MPKRYKDKQISSDECSKKDCNKIAEVFYKSTNRCILHFRIDNIRKGARRKGKFIPSEKWLETNIPKDLICQAPNCGKKMYMDPDQFLADRKDALTLQHNLDGSLTFICFECNAGHSRSILGDDYFLLKKEDKACGDCRVVKSKKEFFNNKTRPDGKQNICKECSKLRKQQPHYMERARARAKERAKESKVL